MRLLRTLLNSGVFMILLLAAVTLYLVYSDRIKQDHGLDNIAQTQPGNKVSTATSAPEAEKVTVVPAVKQATTTEQPQAKEVPTETYPEVTAVAEAVQQVEFPPLEPVQSPVNMATPSLATATDVESILEQARNAYYAGQMPSAAELYRRALAEQRDPDTHGELANVYYAMQNWSGAATEFTHAINGLIEQGRYLQAQYVLGYLMSLDPQQGQESMHKLRMAMYPNE